MTDEGKGLTLLVVEDNDFQRAVAVKVLEDLGCDRVLDAADGQQALETLVAYPDRVHIVLSDLDMPGMDGVEFLRHLGEQKLADAMVVASALDMTLIHTVEDMAQEHGLQVLSNVEKPVTRDKMCRVIEDYRQQQRQHNVGTQPEAFTRAEIEAGLDSGQIVTWYQPKVRISDGAWVSSEALARWIHPEYGVVMPARFVPQMEQQGLIDRLTWSQLHTAVEALHNWRQQGRQLSVAVNLSPTLLDDTDMPAKLESILQHYGVAPARITLELTESVLMQNMARSLETLARLRMKGFALSIDDFGTGFSSQQQLNRIPFTELKIDQSFVRDIEHKASSKTIVQSNIELAHQLSLQAVAEGVETAESWAELKTLGCDLAQGFLIARPMPLSQLGPWEQEWLSRYRSELKS